MRFWPVRMGFAAVVLCLASAMAPADMNAMIEDLAGDDDRDRSVARQLLPREGVAALPALLPLLEDEDIAVSSAAYNVIADISSEVSAPGRERDREIAADYLMALVAHDRSLETKLKGLRLLPIVLPDDGDVGPIAALLDEPELREKAVAALEETGTAKAAAALRRALRGTDPAFKVALLHSLARLRDPKSVAASVRQTRDEDQGVRCAAALAIAWTGDAGLLDDLQRVYGAASPDFKAEAADAIARFAAAAAEQNNDRRTATAAYRDLLADATDVAIRGAALAGLVCHGDDTAAQSILAALDGPDGPQLTPVALTAFEMADRESVRDTLLSVFHGAPVELRARLLGTMGRKQDVAYYALLAEAAQSDDAEYRNAAFAALADSRLPHVTSVLVASAIAANGEARRAIVVELERLADGMHESGQAQAAGQAYLALYGLAPDADTNSRALEGIVRSPTPESYEVVLGAIERGEIGDEAIATLAKLVQGLDEAGRTSERERVAVILSKLANTPDKLREAILVSRELGGIPDLSRRLGFVTMWRISGPFPWSRNNAFSVTHVNEPTVDTSATYPSGDRQIGWEPFKVGNDIGIVDISEAIGEQTNAVAYAVTTVSIPADIDAEARMGSDDGIKLWVNGTAVHENNADRGTQVDQDRAPIQLRAGENALLVAITQGGGGWNFCLRLTRPDGSALPYTIVE